MAHHYFKSCYVEGDTDFIFGRGTAMFDGCEIKYLTARKSNGAILAPSMVASNSYGIFIINSTFTRSGSTSGTVFLGHAWDESVGPLSNYVNGTSPNGQAVIRDSVPGGRFYEFNNTGAGNGG